MFSFNANIIGSKIIGIGGAFSPMPSNIVPLIFDIGQSNAVGRGESNRENQLSAFPELPTNCKIYYKTDYTITDNGTFQQPFAGVNTREPDQTASIFGAYHPLACYIASGFQRTCYIIMMGDGGTALKQNLTNPDWSPSSSGECFEIATQRYYSVAYDKIVAENPTSIILPIICWHQGETDAMDNTATSEYSNNFSNFVTSLRASHSTLNNALMFITKLNYLQTANEATINTVFTNYVASHGSNTILIDVSDQPRKIDLTTQQKGGLVPSTGSDDEHMSYIAQNVKGSRIYDAFCNKYSYLPLAEVTNNTVFDPSTITSLGIRLQFNKSNSTIDSVSSFTALTNNLNTGLFTNFVGTPVPKYKFDYNFKGWVYFVASSNARIESSTAIGTSLFASSIGYSIAFWLRPRDGQTAASQTIIHDIQNTGSPTNSRLGINIATTGKINVFISIGGTTVNATTNNVIFVDGSQTSPTHVAITFTQGDLIRIYVNGVLQTLDASATGNISTLTLTNYVNNTNVLQIGAVRTGASTFTNYFVGMLRELVIQPGVIWNTSQIASIMSN